MRHIILLNAKARHGKDTFAVYLAEELKKRNLSYLISHNAASVKDLAYDYFDWDGIKDDKGRGLLIDITNTGYKYDPYFWEKKNKINILERDFYIIPDWRYIKTLEYFKNKGYKITTVHIDRTNFENNLGESLKNDSSERGFNSFEFDFEIKNESLENLKTYAKIVIDNIIE